MLFDRFIIFFKKLNVYFFIVCLLLISSMPVPCNFFNHLPGQKNSLFTFVKISEAAESKTRSSLIWPHDKSDLSPDPAVIYGRLSNGLRYVLLENHKPSQRVSMHLNVLAGSFNENTDQQGVAHFLEHMLFNGSTHFKPGELVKYFQSIGMKFGADANAHTGYKETVYDILLPDGSRSSLEKGLLIIKDYASGALLLQSEIDKELKVVLAEKRTRDSASYRTLMAATQFEFPATLISTRFPIGKEEILKKADHNVLKTFYDTYYRPDNMILVMVGDFRPKLATELIIDKFSDFKSRAHKVPYYDLGDIKHQGVKAFYHYEKEAGNTSVSIESISKVEAEQDSIDQRRKAIFRSLANRILRQRLDILTSKAKNPFTSSSTWSGYYLDYVKYAEISAECSPENWRKTLKTLEQQLKKALKFGFTASELDQVKKEWLASLDNAVKEAATRESKALARQIIRKNYKNKVFMSPAQLYELYTPIIQAVTLPEIHEAFKQAWEADNRLILVTGNVELTNPLEKIEAIWKAGYKTKISPPVDKRKVVFPYLALPASKGKIIRQTIIDDLDIIQVDFKNKVRLNLKKTALKDNEVLVRIAFGRGRAEEPVQAPGLAYLSTSLINESGLGRLDINELERALSGKKSRVVFGVQENSFYFEGKSVTKEIELLFQLLYAHLVDPGFRKDAFALLTERFEQKYQALNSSIDGAMRLQGNRFLAGGDTRFGLPDYNNFKTLTLNQVKNWTSAPLNNDRLEVSVVGDFEISSLIDLAARYLGTLQPRSETGNKMRQKQPIFPCGKDLNIAVNTTIPKGLVVIAYPTDDFWDIEQTRRINVLADIWSDRLREEIREKMGAAYSAFAFNRASRAYPGYGVLQAYIRVNPKDADMVARQVKKIAQDLANGNIRPDELSRVIGPSLTGIKDLRQTNQYWLKSVLSGSLEHPVQYDWSRSILKDYSAISLKEVKILAKKYFAGNKAATIIIKPKN